MNPLAQFLRALCLLSDSFRTTKSERSPDYASTLVATTKVSIFGELLEVILPSSSEDRNDVRGMKAILISFRNIALQTPRQRRTSATAHTRPCLNFVEGGVTKSLCTFPIPKVGYLTLNNAFPAIYSRRPLMEECRIQVAFADVPHLELRFSELALELEEVDLKGAVEFIKS